MSYQDFKFEHHYQENTFNAVLTEQLKKTPWLLISFIIHAIILLILSQFSVYGNEEQNVVPFNVSENETTMEEEEMPIVEEETEEINPEEEVTEEPVVKDPKDSPMLKAGAELIMKRLPVWEPNTGKVDMYYWYYATLSMFQMGGSYWTAWNNKMKEAIVNSQRKDGNFAGSWDNVDPWGEDGGRVYSTAVMTMCLEVYYRYRRVFGTR